MRNSGHQKGQLGPDRFRSRELSLERLHVYLAPYGQTYISGQCYGIEGLFYIRVECLGWFDE
jgi:hypothetical protein